jgi:uncharacterized protein (TIGR02678 family)
MSLQRAARALLVEPLLHGEGDTPDAVRRAEVLRLVRQHRGPLQEFFAGELGYRLVVDRTAARLVKLDPGAEPPRPLLRRTGKPFTPRGYAMLCLLLAVLEGGRKQYLVDELVREVRAAASDAGLDVDLESATDRRALHAALTVLVGYGVLRERDGELARWAEDERVQSLLDVDVGRLGLVVLGLPPISTAEDLLAPETLPTSVGGARLATRRRLVESPLLDVSELDEQQRDWWSKNRVRERDWYADRLGLALELRAEGALAIDPDEELTDTPFPGPGSARHVALLVLEQVVQAARATPAARVQVPAPVVDQAFLHVTATHPVAVSTAYREDQAGLRAAVTEVLRATGLVHVDDAGDWSVHAAAARFAPKPVVVAAALFEDSPWPG